MAEPPHERGNRLLIIRARRWQELLLVLSAHAYFTSNVCGQVTNTVYKQSCASGVLFFFLKIKNR